jgi:hypothetical protein
MQAGGTAYNGFPEIGTTAVMLESRPALRTTGF